MNTSLNFYYPHFRYVGLTAYLYLLIGCQMAFAQNSEIHFRVPDLNEELPEKSPRAIIQDHLGYIWMGTQNGLTRYDGHNLTRYLPDPDDPYSFKGRMVLNMIEDSLGNLWIATLNNGLIFYDRKTERFHSFKHDPDDPNSISDNQVIGLKQDPEGYLWIFSLNGLLDRIHIQSHEIQRYRHDPENENTVRNDTIFNGGIAFGWEVDQGGDMWLSFKRGGFDRIDMESGSIKHYLKDSLFSKGLKHDTVYQFLRDPEDVLWLATTGGLYHYVPETDQFVHHPFGEALSAQLESQTIYRIHADKLGRLWLSLPNNLVLFDTKKTAFQSVWKSHLAHRTQFPAAVGQRKNGDVWIALVNQKTLMLYDHAEGQITFQKEFLPDQRTLMMGFLIDESDLLWIGFFLQGLLIEDRQANNFTQFHQDQPDAILEDNMMQEILGDQSGLVWIGTKNGGLYRLNPENATLRKISLLPDEDKLDINNIFEVSQNELWVSVPQKGLFKLNRKDPEKEEVNLALNRPVQVSSTEHRYYDPEALTDGRNFTRWSSNFNDGEWAQIDLGSRQEIGRLVLHWESAFASRYQIQVSNNGRNWRTIHRENRGKGGVEDIELKGTGRYVRLQCLNRQTNYGVSLFEIEIYGPQPEAVHLNALRRNPYKVPSAYVYDMHRDDNGQIWLASSLGLARFDEGKQAFETISIYPDQPNSNLNLVHDILDDQKGNFWLLPQTGRGIVRYDTERDTFHIYSGTPGEGKGLHENQILQQTLDSDGNVWFTGNLRGLHRYDAEADTFVQYIDVDQAFTTIINIYEDSQNRLWVGTFQGGICLIDADSGIKHCYTHRDGLPADMVTSITEDKNGYLWMQTQKGLSRFDPETETFLNYGEKDGLRSVSSTFIRKDLQENIYLASQEGFQMFHPDSLKRDSTLGPIAITQFRLFNQRVVPGPESPLADNIGKVDKITLSHDQNVIAFEFASLHFASPEDNHFAVMMVGLDTAWHYIGNRNYMSYAGLSAGDYTFRVKGTNGNGVWNEEIAEVNITILPPWWRTWWAYLLYVVLLGAGIRLFISWRTRVQRKKLEETQKVNDRLRAIDKMKDQFLANTSHELRTPLNGIIGISEALQEKAADDFQKENLSLVIASGKRLASLVNDLLDFSKLKNQEFDIHLKAVNLAELVNLVLKTIAHLVGDKEIELKQDIPEDLPTVLADGNRLQQILYNLVGNAIKFTESGEVVVRAIRQGEQVELSVLDTGIGIPKEKQASIFQAFEQADGSIERKFGGTGLGLTITKQLIELHGSQIQLESEPGKGSRFYFHLGISGEPVESSDLAAVHAFGQAVKMNQPSIQATEATNGATINGHIRILVVDDEPINQQVMKNHLSGGNYVVTQALNGAEALDALENNESYDLVLLDVMMPQMSGYQVCQKIRENYLPSELPVILVTAKNQVEDLVEGLSSGANDYLAKPFRKEELLARVKTHLDLNRINRVTGKFVPNEFLRSLGKERITEVVLGDQVQREVTVMFSDIRGYTALAETMTPDENFRFVNAFNGRMGPIIRKNRGFVNQYLGDSIMAIYPENPKDSLRAAIEMQEVLRTYNAQRKSQNRKGIRTGIGLHSGSLIMGIIGDEQRMDAATVSDTVNTASRVESLTKYYGANILLSGPTMTQIEDLNTFHFRYLGPVQVKGRQEPIKIYECVDGDPESIRQRKIESLDHFNQGLSNYLNKAFDQALKDFQLVLVQNPQDLVAQHFIQKIQAYQKNGIPDDWTGVEIMTRK